MSEKVQRFNAILILGILVGKADNLYFREISQGIFK